MAETPSIPPLPETGDNLQPPKEPAVDPHQAENPTVSMAPVEPVENNTDTLFVPGNRPAHPYENAAAESVNKAFQLGQMSKDTGRWILEQLSHTAKVLMNRENPKK